MEQIINNSLADKLEEIADLEAEIKSQEKKYYSLLKEDEQLEVLREMRIKIKYLKALLKAKEDSLRIYPIR